MRHFADVTPDLFGTRDSDKWEEYRPSCATWDGVPFGVAEPLNAISTLAFDQLLCAANLSFGHTAISQLGFGTFGFHTPREVTTSPTCLTSCPYTAFKCRSCTS